MLHHFLSENRDELVTRCRAKVTARRAPRASEAELRHGIPLFLEQLIATLQAELPSSPTPMLLSATRHGDELLQSGFTVAQVIHDYGDLCQSITELAAEMEAPVTPEEFGVLNRCLDDAIAAAVTEFSLQRERVIEAEGTHSAEMQLGILAHELRNLLGAAMLSFELIRRGSVAVNGATGMLHDRALRGLRDLVDRALTDVRLSIGIQKEPMSLGEFIGEVESSAAMEAAALAMRLSVPPVDEALAIVADRQILAAVLANLLQNAFKFTRANGHLDVSLRVHQAADRVFIDVEDECGGLPSGTTEELFQPFAQRGGDRTGLGLGLTICRRGVEANDGLLHVRNVPGHGCVFSVEMALSPVPVS